jgi:hypothetical protein
MRLTAQILKGEQHLERRQAGRQPFIGGQR